MLLSELIHKIKQKKELAGLSEELVSEIALKYIKKHNLNLNNLSKHNQKPIIKETRAQLRELVGRFEKHTKKRPLFLEKNQINELLKTHTSTSERLANYDEIKAIIASLNVSSILDLGCGLNPIALASPNVYYYALDINKNELDLIKLFFQKNNIKGETILHDLRKAKELPKADICLAFKVLDLLDKKGHRTAENLINSVNCKYLLISFPTITISGKPMSTPRRFWLENLLIRLSFRFKKFKIGNEIFYLAEKQSAIC